MKKYIFSGFLTVYLFTVFNVAAQDFWEQLYFPDTVTIRCITTNDNGDIFIGVGNSNEAGGVYRSTDNAQTWECVYDNNGFGVHTIAIDASGYVYVGKNGSARLIVSKSNGENWEDIILPPPSSGNMVKILSVGHDTIYISTWETSGSLLTFSFDGAETWEHSYVTDHSNEYITDIAVSTTGEIFVSTNGFFFDQGGVYKSQDNGTTWEYIGLLNHQVMTIEINSNNDVFTGDWWVMYDDTPGIHALYEGANTFDLIFGAYHVTDIVIDSNDKIYAAANEGVVVSYDNGYTFEQVEDVLSATIEFLHIGTNGFLYGIRFNRIVKSINPIITGDKEHYHNGITELVKTYPNPVHDILKVCLSTKSITNNFCAVYIYDVYGKLIYENEKTFLSDCFQLDVNILARGCYIISIQLNGKIYNSNFIKK